MARHRPWWGWVFAVGVLTGPLHAITIRAAGDAMLAPGQLAAARVSASGDYSFRLSFAAIAPLLRDADLAIANLETVLAGPAVGYSGYPRFNSPAAFAAALHWAGIGLLTTANNHCLDQGEPGLSATIARLDRLGIRHTGTFATQLERERPLLPTVGDCRVAVLAATEHTNGIAGPAPYLVSRLADDQLAQQVAGARRAGAELVVAMVHWGTEWAAHPSGRQREQAGWLAAAGVDVVFGSHPHVVQPIEWLATPDGGRMLCYWSLGNFVADQRERHSDEGLLADVGIARDSGGRPRVTRAGFMPTFIDRSDVAERRRCRVVPAETGGARARAAWARLVGLCANPSAGIDVTRVDLRAAAGAPEGNGS